MLSRLVKAHSRKHADHLIDDLHIGAFTVPLLDGIAPWLGRRPGPIPPRARGNPNDVAIVEKTRARPDEGLGTGKTLDNFDLVIPPAWRDVEIAVSTRIGITKAQELPWRFCVAGTKFASRPFPRADRA